MPAFLLVMHDPQRLRRCGAWHLGRRGGGGASGEVSVPRGGGRVAPVQAARRRRRRASSVTRRNDGRPIRCSRQARRPGVALAAGIVAASMGRRCQHPFLKLSGAEFIPPAKPPPAWAVETLVGEVKEGIVRSTRRDRSESASPTDPAQPKPAHNRQAPKPSTKQPNGQTAKAQSPKPKAQSPKQIQRFAASPAQSSFRNVKFHRSGGSRPTMRSFVPPERSSRCSDIGMPALSE